MADTCFYQNRKTLLQGALLLTAVAPLCLYIAYKRVAPASPSHYIILFVAAAVGLVAAINWLEWALAARPIIIVGDDALKIRKMLSTSCESIPWGRISEIQPVDQIKSNVLRHRFVAIVDGQLREIPTQNLTVPAQQAEQAILDAYQASK